MENTFPADLLAMVQRQVVDYGQIGATSFIRVPDLAAAIPVAGGAFTPSEVAAPLLVFNESGWVIAMYGQERTGTPAKFAATELRLQVNGESDLITQGQSGGAFFPFLGLFGPNLNWKSLLRRVEKNDPWQITYRNFDTGATAIPVVGFAFLSDAQVSRMASRMVQ